MNLDNIEFEYLSELTNEEFRSVTGIMKKYGMRGLLGLALEVTEMNLLQGKAGHEAEMFARELNALMGKMDQ